MPEELTDTELEDLASMLDLARDGDSDGLTTVVRAGVPVNLTGPTGDTLLILAAYHNHPAAVQALLAEGADPERVNDRGQTALAAAVFRQNTASVRALLAAGADPDTGARSAVQIAEFFGLTAMRALLEQQRA